MAIGNQFIGMDIIGINGNRIKILFFFFGFCSQFWVLFHKSSQIQLVLGFVPAHPRKTVKYLSAMKLHSAFWLLFGVVQKVTINMYTDCTKTHIPIVPNRVYRLYQTHIPIVPTVQYDCTTVQYNCTRPILRLYQTLDKKRTIIKFLSKIVEERLR